MRVYCSQEQLYLLGAMVMGLCNPLACSEPPWVLLVGGSWLHLDSDIPVAKQTNCYSHFGLQLHLIFHTFYTAQSLPDFLSHIANLLTTFQEVVNIHTLRNVILYFHFRVRNATLNYAN